MLSAAVGRARPSQAVLQLHQGKCPSSPTHILLLAIVVAGASRVPLTSLACQSGRIPAITIELDTVLHMAQSRPALSASGHALPRAVSSPLHDLPVPPYTASVGSQARHESLRCYGPPPCPVPPDMAWDQAVLAARGLGEWGSEQCCLPTNEGIVRVSHAVPD